MRLIRDVGNNLRNPLNWPSEMTDDRIKKCICDLGAEVHGDVSERTLQHMMQVFKLIHRFHYPVKAPTFRNVGDFTSVDLKWLWQGGATLPLLFPSKVLAPVQMAEYDTLLAQVPRYSRELSNCFMSCWREVVALQVSTSSESALLIDAALTDDMLLLVLRFCAANHDLWSQLNIVAKESVQSVLALYRCLQSGGLKVLRLFSRIASRGILDYKEALAIDTTTKDATTRRNAQVAATRPIMEISLMQPFVLAFFIGLTGEKFDRSLFYKAILFLDAYRYENIVWWLVAMLCREDWSVWSDNVRPHVRDLVNTWDSGSPSISSDVALVARLECVVAYILSHSSQENRLVTGRNDKEEAPWIFTESAAPRYRPKVQA
ncbi:hypothetical protein CC86DRAFT_404984 [Ophiobolus disseminans]|uniref:Uncharacterized protein n=1 Tax=Ophiobolus disseminans TaxID=1469910 RepID=A0A6A7A3S5_9PLEO|nr:hypothetical protein CC86DRAFT_404984 [Ophiobolus disseminans]